jgi:NADPH-dependent curcumin reductase CurA
MPNLNRRFVLAARPQELVTPDVLKLAETELHPLQDGEALARVKYLSIDPTMRVWMDDIPQYMPPVKLGEVMRSFGLAEITESRHADFKKGDKVMGLTGLQEYAVISSHDPHGFQKLPSVPFLSDTNFLGTLGVNGLTAYFGLLDIGKPRPGETLVVSGAAGQPAVLSAKSARSTDAALLASPAPLKNVNGLRTSLASMRPSTTSSLTGSLGSPPQLPRESTSTSKMWEAKSWKPFSTA